MSKSDSKKIKVLIISPSIRVLGGQSIQSDRLRKTFEADEKIEMDFLPNDPKNIFQDVKILRTIFTSLKFWRLLLTNVYKYDIVHIFSSGGTSYLISTLPPLFLAKIFRVRAVLNYHSGELEAHIEKWKKTALPTMKKFDETVVPSAFLADVFAKYDLNAKAIFNFADSERFKFKERKTLRPIFISNRNFEEHYNVADCLRAFQIIQNKLPEAELIVAGFGSKESELKKLAEDLRLEKISFVGRIPNDEMPELLSKADVYLNASIVDNMPLSLIEAFAAGTPVVSYATGGIPYIVENKKTGLLVETGDFHSLARKAISVFDNQDEAQKIISNARNEVEKYNREAIKKDWTRFYELCMKIRNIK